MDVRTFLQLTLAERMFWVPLFGASTIAGVILGCGIAIADVQANAPHSTDFEGFATSLTVLTSLTILISARSLMAAVLGASRDNTCQMWRCGVSKRALRNLRKLQVILVSCAGALGAIPLTLCLGPGIITAYLDLLEPGEQIVHTVSIVALGTGVWMIPLSFGTVAAIRVRRDTMFAEEGVQKTVLSQSAIRRRRGIACTVGLLLVVAGAITAILGACARTDPAEQLSILVGSGLGLGSLVTGFVVWAALWATPTVIRYAGAVLRVSRRESGRLGLSRAQYRTHQSAGFVIAMSLPIAMIGMIYAIAGSGISSIAGAGLDTNVHADTLILGLGPPLLVGFTNIVAVGILRTSTVVRENIALRAVGTSAGILWRAVCAESVIYVLAGALCALVPVLVTMIFGAVAVAALGGRPAIAVPLVPLIVLAIGAFIGAFLTAMPTVWGSRLGRRRHGASSGTPSRAL